MKTTAAQLNLNSHYKVAFNEIYFFINFINEFVYQVVVTQFKVSTNYAFTEIR